MRLHNLVESLAADLRAILEAGPSDRWIASLGRKNTGGLDIDTDAVGSQKRTADRMAAAALPDPSAAARERASAQRAALSSRAARSVTVAATGGVATRKPAGLLSRILKR